MAGSEIRNSTLEAVRDTGQAWGHPQSTRKRYRAFLKKLKQARADAKLTQRQVAAALGRLQSYVEKCEQGSRRVDAVELFEFAAVYGKPVEFFDPEARAKFD